MKEILKFLFRIVFTPIALMMIGGTAFLEFMSRKSDWEYWRDYNRAVFEMLPFKIDI